MTKKRTKLQKCGDYYDAYKAIKEDRPVKRSGRKDGSIATQPIVLVKEHLSEKEILHQCLMWLKRKRIFCNRHDAGTFQNNRGEWGTYGIKGAGDIIGLFPDGRHFEIECKRGKGSRLSVGQQKRRDSIKRNNGIYLIVHGVEELEWYNKMYHTFDRDSLEGIE